MLRHPGYLCCFLFSFFFFLFSTVARANTQEISIGGSAIFGARNVGIILANYRLALGSEGNWAFFYGAETKLMFPKGTSLGVNFGPPLIAEYRGLSWRPYVMVMPGYAYIREHLLSFEAIAGASLELKELQGLRVYSGYSYMGSHGVILGLLIFLAW